MGTVEWEGKAEQVAWHPPYILLFDRRFVEIRHLETGRLVQIICGNNIRCTWDGRGTNKSQPACTGTSGEAVSRQPGVHGVMNVEGPHPDRGTVTTKHVFELVPRVPLPGLPGSFALPSSTPYTYWSYLPVHLAS